jgi:hypothetical protein
VDYFNYLGSLMTDDAKGTQGNLNPGLSWQKQLSTRRFSSPANWT